MNIIVRHIAIASLSTGLLWGGLAGCRRNESTAGSSAAATPAAATAATAATAAAATPGAAGAPAVAQPVAPTAVPADPTAAAAAAVPALPLPAMPAPGAAAANSPVRFSCNRPSSGHCADYTQASLDGRGGASAESMLHEGCNNSSGTWAATPCATASVLGTCSTPEGDLIRYYAGGASHMTAERASTNCSDAVGGFAGTWAATAH